jgi:WD40 repeat protein
VLLEARSRMRTDPTATVAWLKEYPVSAPHQDELIALVDEAAGRLVARHVWYPPSATVDAEFADDGALVVTTHDGEIVRIDAATGARRQLAKLSAVPIFARARGGRVLVIDEAGRVWRVEHGVVSVTTPAPLARPTGLYLAPDGGIKLTFATDDAVWIGEPMTKLPEFSHADDETEARKMFGVTETGELDLVDGTPHKVWQFTPGTWVRSSIDGSHYMVLAPHPDRSASVWFGTPPSPPVEVATARACAGGEDRDVRAELTDDGRIAAVWRCGVLAVYDGVARRTIPIADSERVTHFVLSPDGRWLAVGHGDGFDLIELATGGSRRLDVVSTISILGFSRDSRWLFGVGIEQGIRVWSVEGDAALTAPLGEVATPIRISLGHDHELAIRRHLDCSIWSTTEHRLVADATVTIAEASPPDDDQMLWPRDATDDGRTCLFGGHDATSVVVGMAGATHTITARADDCVLSNDGRAAWCARDDALVSIEVASDRTLSSRPAGGKVHGVVRFRGSPLALVRHPTSCTLETFSGSTVATLPRSDDCTSPQAIGDTGVMIARAGNTAVWSNLGVVELSSPSARTVVSPAGDRAAVWVDERVEIWDLRMHVRVPGPPAHVRAIGDAAWSTTGILASSDDETIQLWDPATQRTRAIFAPHVASLVWSRDGGTLYASDGRLVQAWPIDLAKGASPAEVRARFDQLTTARIVDGRAATP